MPIDKVLKDEVAINISLTCLESFVASSIRSLSLANSHMQKLKMDFRNHNWRWVASTNFVAKLM